MAADGGPPRPTELGLTLLAIARKKDRHRALAASAALVGVLDLGRQLLWASESARHTTWKDVLGSDAEPEDFVSLVATLLQRAQNQLDHRDRRASRSEGKLLVRDYDPFIYHGFSQALADLLWSERAVRDFDGPSFAVCKERLTGLEVDELWRRTIQHYLANVLQYYFAAASSGDKNRIDPALESILRDSDADNVAAYALRLAPDETMGEPTPELAAFGLDLAISEILEIGVNE